MTTTDSQVVLRDGARVSFAEVGAADGRPVIYLHGTPSSRLEVTAALDEPARRLGLRIVAPDRPGCGRSTFRPYTVTDYPAQVAAFADALAIDDFALIGVSGGGRYACASASALNGRVRSVALVASTAPPELAGVRDTWSRQDRQLYGLAVKAPWLLRAYLARTARQIRSDVNQVQKLFSELSDIDKEMLAREDVRSTLSSMLVETFHQGTRGAVHDFGLEARPWRVVLSTIVSPIDVWHGDADTIVPIAQAHILADALPDPRRNFMAGEGHLSLRVNYATEILEQLR